MKFKFTTFFCLVTLFYFGQTNRDQTSGKTNNNDSQSQKAPKLNWLDTFDLDGDGVNDLIYFDSSEGAHCCYKINIVLSSDKIERKFPFEMDGGYVGIVDNSRPEQFDIRDVDNDGLPEILMRIGTYNGIPYKMPFKWRITYGIKSHYIVIEYRNRRLQTKDYKLKK